MAAAASQGNPVDPRTLRPVVLPGAPFPEDHGDLLGVLKSLTAGPAILDNDFNWSALAEQRTGVGRGVDEMLLVYLGPGIGAGVVMSGQAQRGFRGAVGELGYLRYVRHTLLEELLSLEIGTPGGHRLSQQACAELFAGGAAAERGQRFVRILDSALANVALVLDSESLVLSGPLIEIPALATALETELLANTSMDSLRIQRAGLGEDSPLIGAGIAARNLAIEELWSSYRMQSALGTQCVRVHAPTAQAGKLAHGSHAVERT